MYTCSLGAVVILYLILPKPTFLWLYDNPDMEFIGALQKSWFWWVEVGFLGVTLEASENPEPLNPKPYRPSTLNPQTLNP